MQIDCVHMECALNEFALKMQIEPIHLRRWFECELEVDWINLRDNFVTIISTQAHSIRLMLVKT